MRWLKHILVLSLVALWPLAMNHCKIESFTGFDFVQCSDHATNQGGCADDACLTVESGSCRVENNQPSQAIVAALRDIHLTELLLPEPPPAPVVSFSLTAAPPEISATRQFVFRTAASPRAPSLAS